VNLGPIHYTSNVGLPVEPADRAAAAKTKTLTPISSPTRKSSPTPNHDRR
jgi:hypothetical protein